MVLASGGIEGGIQCLYFSIVNDTWEIISHASMPYSQKITAAFTNAIAKSTSGLTFDEWAFLDYKLSSFYLDVAKTTLSRLPTALRKPHFILLVKSCLSKCSLRDDTQQQQQLWDISPGDAQFVASSLQVPVFTDIIRHHCIAGGQGILPTTTGNIRIASLAGGTVVLVNIGLVSRMTIIDTKSASVLVDSDSGPGTCCINALMRKQAGENTNEGFDRDGSFAAQGSVNSELLTEFTNAPWFLEAAPKQAAADVFVKLLDNASMAACSMPDQCATVTALTARSIYDFFRREFRGNEPDISVFISGGGSHNQTLHRYLQTYFDTIPVKNIEELGIPADMRTPLAFGLTINAWLRGESISWESGTQPVINSPGKWVLP